MIQIFTHFPLANDLIDECERSDEQTYEKISYGQTDDQPILSLSAKLSISVNRHYHQ